MEAPGCNRKVDCRLTPQKLRRINKKRKYLQREKLACAVHSAARKNPGQLSPAALSLGARLARQNRFKLVNPKHKPRNAR
jgi:hypothetical protein